MKAELKFGWLTILFFIFLILKLTGNIDWSWWWITSPIWIPVALFIFLLLIYGLLFRSAIKTLKRLKENK